MLEVHTGLRIFDLFQTSIDVDSIPTKVLFKCLKFRLELTLSTLWTMYIIQDNQNSLYMKDPAYFRLMSLKYFIMYNLLAVKWDSGRVPVQELLRLVLLSSYFYCKTVILCSGLKSRVSQGNHRHIR